ncbi:MAG: hypothetical protein OHK005_08100 [Candidatus Methylacidiphilales bacterium]
MMINMLKNLNEMIHRSLFFSEPTQRIAWPTLAWLMRTRPFLSVLDRIEGLDGDVVECGVFWGRSLVPIALALQKRGVMKKTVFGLDSFNGFEEDDLRENDLGAGRSMETLRGRFRQEPRIVSDLQRVIKALNLQVKIVPGTFAKNPAPAPGELV